MVINTYLQIKEFFCKTQLAKVNLAHLTAVVQFATPDFEKKQTKTRNATRCKQSR